ncbi:zinc-ribbon domain-containing protein [Companilactobacillus allii]|uniref:Zinc-ribbon domain-containing protein n=1 Tax=Companilactobacillus allii TaxID=1847728 RepID=A0A1P8Q2D9_9LACO|nr:zinc-ribbon domain-containing protein [Companilactobacillus allii]APX71996.1 hypothetical protein BTM29_05230 [Companilactobacillus allii]USQ69090.1 zinc-ribbon domain-containing protein [Companilactobacillus allii]
MFCPNCGQRVDPSQKFCDHCGYDLTSIKNKRNESDQNQAKKDDDTIKSLADIEAELNDSEPESKSVPEKEINNYQQAPAQKKEYNSLRQASEVENTKQNTVRTFESTKKVPDDTLDDRTVAYDKDAFRQASKKPYQYAKSAQEQHDPSLNETQDLGKKFKERFKTSEDPFKPTKSEMKKLQQKKKQQEESDTSDGLIHNMGKFAKNNIYLCIFAVIIVAILLVVKRNYGFIALALAVLLWFLASQVSHGGEVSANKKFKRDNHPQSGSDEYNENNDHQEQQYKEPKKHKTHDNRRGKNMRQKVIIGSSVIGFVASIGGPFINGVSLSSTIASAASYTANFGYQYSTIIVNLSSAIRLICFLSPIIAMIAACFRNRGSVKLVRLFTVLPTIIYAVVFAIFYSGAVNSALITGQTAVNGTQFGISFYILLVTSIVSLVMAYALHPRERL